MRAGRFSSLGIPDMPPVLRQIVRDVVHRRRQADENGGDRGGIDQGSHGSRKGLGTPVAQFDGRD